MSRSLHTLSFPGKYLGHTCDLNEVDDPGLDVPCRAPLAAHPGRRCTDRRPGEPIAEAFARDGRRAVRRHPRGYARTWYRDRMSEYERDRTRRERRATAQVLGQLSGEVGQVAALADELLGEHPHVADGPAPDVTWDVI